MELVRELFAEYGRSIGVEIDENNPQYSLILVATDGVEAGGCAAMREIATGVAELKRLYVREPYRGTGLGRRLAEAVIAEARVRGYQVLRLDTLPSMRAAIGIYESLGFRPIPAYHNTPLPGMMYFELSLG
jgi:GNAT superfamily N-acetyltransferase